MVPLIDHKKVDFHLVVRELLKSLRNGFSLLFQILEIMYSPNFGMLTGIMGDKWNNSI